MLTITAATKTTPETIQVPHLQVNCRLAVLGKTSFSRIVIREGRIIRVATPAISKIEEMKIPTVL